MLEKNNFIGYGFRGRKIRDFLVASRLDFTSREGAVAKLISCPASPEAGPYMS